MADAKQKFFVHIQNVLTQKEKVGHLHTASISKTIDALGRLGWHAVTCRLAGVNDKKNFANQTLKVIRLG